MLIELLSRLAGSLRGPRSGDSPERCLAAAIELQNSGDFAEAERLIRKFLLQNPDHCDATHLLASILMRQKRHADAVALLLKVTRWQPLAMEAFYNLGSAYSSLGRHLDAAASFHRAVELSPDFAEASCSLGNALKAAGRADDAELAYKEALRLKPEFAEAIYNLGNLYHQVGLVAQAIDCYQRACVLKPSFVTAHSNYIYALNFLPDHTPRKIFDAHLEWADRHAKPLGVDRRFADRDISPDRPLRVGYVSPNFRNHAATYFFESTLASHDNARFRTFCYSDVLQEDDHTRKLRLASSEWRACAELTDDGLLALILRDRIDILIDLTGHTEGNRLLVFARRAAPLQVTWNGYANTTGLSTMDYRITDALADPPGMTDSIHTEKLLRLPAVYMVYTPPEESPPVNALPAVSLGHITFGSFNAVSKITPRVGQVWARILTALPGSRLLLATVPEGNARERMVEMFAGLGISRERLELHDRLPQSEFLGLHQRADIGLDPFPFCGTTTTCQSLWMGVPVITLAGSAHVSRVGISMLTNVGLPELVAQNEEQYVDIAIELARNIARLEELRRGLRAKMLHSPLTDAGTFTRYLERAYRSIWTDWCGSRK
jgi:protein O-GlcNAc transferase